MLEVCPLLQSEFNYQRILCLLWTNLSHHTHVPSSKVDVGIWLGFASHGRAHHTGNADSEMIHKVIVDVFDVFLEGRPVFYPHALSQIEP